jgi:hypothetical protein
MARMKIKINRRGMHNILNSPEVAREVHHVAEDIKDLAYEFAPEVTGAYKNSLEVLDDHSDRAISLVNVGVDYGLEVEAKHAPLGRAANARTGS